MAIWMILDHEGMDLNCRFDDGQTGAPGDEGFDEAVVQAETQRINGERYIYVGPSDGTVDPSAWLP